MNDTVNCFYEFLQNSVLPSWSFLKVPHHLAVPLGQRGCVFSFNRYSCMLMHWFLISAVKKTIFTIQPSTAFSIPKKNFHQWQEIIFVHFCSSEMVVWWERLFSLQCKKDIFCNDSFLLHFLGWLPAFPLQMMGLFWTSGCNYPT